MFFRCAPPAKVRRRLRETTARTATLLSLPPLPIATPGASSSFSLSRSRDLHIQRSFTGRWSAWVAFVSTQPLNHAQSNHFPLSLSLSFTIFRPSDIIHCEWIRLRNSHNRFRVNEAAIVGWCASFWVAVGGELMARQWHLVFPVSVVVERAIYDALLPSKSMEWQNHWLDRPKSSSTCIKTSLFYNFFLFKTSFLKAMEWRFNLI